MPPAAKKRRIVDPVAGKPPIVFNARGLAIDTCLTVFGEDFHVCSVILRLHSDYFRRFLDSADKSGAPASLSFQYHYTTVIDKDGTWALEPVQKAPPLDPASIGLVIGVNEEVEAFQLLLCAIHNRPYTVDTTYTLKVLTRLADFYRCLPIISATLSGALLNSQIFKASEEHLGIPAIAQEAGRLIYVAQQLRHPILFRECVIHIVGKWHDSNWMKRELPNLEEDDVLWCLLSKEHAVLTRKLLWAHQGIMLNLPNLFQSCVQNTDLLLEGCVPEAGAEFFQAIRAQVRGDTRAYPGRLLLLSRLDDLLQNNLLLDRTGCNAGEGPHNHFLCADIPDEKLPWNLGETEW